MKGTQLTKKDRKLIEKLYLSQDPRKQQAVKERMKKIVNEKAEKEQQ